VTNDPAAKVTIAALAAPTAAGKTAAALTLAEQPGGEAVEVIVADALQVYRGFDVGTAKPTIAERARVPHQLIDAFDPEQAVNVAGWLRAAEGAIEEVLARGGRPLVVAGTGFYLEALASGLPGTPPADAALRAELGHEWAARGTAALLAELAAAAPADAAGCQGNPRRVLRALEVLRATGRPPSSFPRRAPRFAVRTFVANPAAAVLEARIDARLRAMISAGWVGEVEALAARVPADAPAWQAIGYRALARAIRGEVALSAALAEVRTATRQYAKRQRTYFARRPTAALRRDGALEGETLAAFVDWFVSGF
jgi:tRNA dimethylallyltransferase